MTVHRKSESMTPAGKLALSCRDKAIDDPTEGQHGHAAAGHHRVVELAEIKALAQGLLRPGAQSVDLAVTHLVAAGLARPGAVAIHFTRDFIHGGTVGTGKPLDGLLASPALHVQAGIDHQPAGAKRDRL